MDKKPSQSTSTYPQIISYSQKFLFVCNKIDPVGV